MVGFVFTYLIPSTSLALVLGFWWAMRKNRVLAADLSVCRASLDSRIEQLTRARAELEAVHDILAQQRLSALRLDQQLRESNQKAAAVMAAAQDLARRIAAGDVQAEEAAAKITEAWNA